jgi:hypothetical protein
MKTMSIAPEQVQAPARDAVLFRSSPVRTFAAVFVILMLSYVVAAPLVGFVAAGGGGSWGSTVLQAVVIGAVVAGAYAYSSRAALTTWVRMSSAGLEMAAQGSDPILLAWEDIATVVVRRVGLRTVLDVTPLDLDRVHPVQGGGPGWPAMEITEDGTSAFMADLSELWPGPRALRRELAHRMHPERRTS